MNERLHDLILALVAGSLTNEETAAAEAEIAADVAAAAELSLQRAAREALLAAPPAGLTEVERAYLHQRVAAGLGLDTAIPTVTRSRRRFRFSWAKLAPIAAVFLAFAIGLPLAGTFLSGNDAEPVADSVPLSQVATEAPSGEDSARFATSDTAQATTTTRTVPKTTLGESAAEGTLDAATSGGEGDDGPGDSGPVLPDFGSVDDAAVASLVAIVARGPDATASAAPAVHPVTSAAECDTDPGYGLSAPSGEPVLFLSYEGRDAVAYWYEAEETLVVFSIPACDPLVAAGPDGILAP